MKREPTAEELERRHRPRRQPARRGRRWNDDPLYTPAEVGQDDGRTPKVSESDWLRIVVAGPARHDDR